MSRETSENERATDVPSEKKITGPEGDAHQNLSESWTEHYIERFLRGGKPTIALICVKWPKAGVDGRPSGTEGEGEKCPKYCRARLISISCAEKG